MGDVILLSFEMHDEMSKICEVVHYGTVAHKLAVCGHRK